MACHRGVEECVCSECSSFRNYPGFSKDKKEGAIPIDTGFMKQTGIDQSSAGIKTTPSKVSYPAGRFHCNSKKIIKGE